jgi:HEAT repeat protein
MASASRSPNVTRAPSVVLAAVLAISAGLLACSRGEPRGPRSSSAGAAATAAAPGDERRWALRLHIELARPSRPEPLLVVLTGELAAAVSEVRSDEYDVAYELVHPDITGSGVPSVAPAELEGLRRRLGRTFWATYRRDGAALRVHFPRDVEPADRNLLQILVTDAQLVRPLPSQSHWTVLERDAVGMYLAAYEQPTPGQVLKRKLKYVETDGATGVTAPNALAVDLTASERRFALDATGAVVGVDGTESSRIPLPMTEGQSLAVTIALRLTDARSGRAPGRAGSLERARGDVDTSPIRTHRPSAEATQAARDERVLEGHSAAALLEAARSGDPDSLLPRRLEALFRRQPATVASAVALIRSQAGSRRVSDALGAAATPSCVEALLALARDAGLPSSVRVDALVSLFNVKHPEPPLLAGTSRLLDDPDRLVSRAAQLTLGALARAARPTQPIAAAAADEELALRYAPSSPVEERVALFGALGNSAGPASIRVLKGGLRDSAPEVRAAAARDLRAADDGEVDALVATALREDPDPRVRAAAIFAVGYRAPDPFIDVLVLAATHDRVDAVRSGAVGLLRKYQAVYPAAGAALRRVAAADAKPSLRRLAREALADADRPGMTARPR